MTATTFKMSLDFVQKSSEISDESKKFFLGENAGKFHGFADLPIPEKIINTVE